MLGSMSKSQSNAEPKLYREVRAAIAKSSRTNYELAQTLDIDRAALGRFINGKRGLSVELLERVCAELGYELTLQLKKGGKRK
jgi:transcriptional regulator with XRE-family HTH domain